MKLKDIGQAVMLLVATMVVVAGASIVSNLFKKPAVVEVTPETRPIVSCDESYLGYQQLKDVAGQTISLVPKREDMYVVNGDFINSKVVLAKSETETSKVACGYLVVRAGTRGGALQTWEDVIVDPSGFGGHLKPDSAISINENTEYSQYVYSLNHIEYWPTHHRKMVNTADWAALLNVQQVVPFTIAFNTEDVTGFVDEVSIVYKCWNPQDGTENKDCKLKIESSETSTDPLP